jgi:hypothetical protein
MVPTAGTLATGTTEIATFTPSTDELLFSGGSVEVAGLKLGTVAFNRPTAPLPPAAALALAAALLAVSFGAYKQRSRDHSPANARLTSAPGPNG